MSTSALHERSANYAPRGRRDRLRLADRLGVDRSPSCGRSPRPARGGLRRFDGTHLLPQPVRHRQLRRADRRPRCGRRCTARTEVEIRHLAHAPRNIDYYAPKHLAETEIMTAAVEAERDGFDAFVIGCCYDPALTQCRELVEHPRGRPARGVRAAVAAVRPLLRRRDRPPQGRARAARPRPPVRAGGQLPRRRRHRLVRHRHGPRPDDGGQGHLRQGAGRDAHDRRRDRRHRLHDRLGLLRAGRARAATPTWPRCRSSTRT